MTGMTRLNTTAFILICVIIVLTTILYGTVHQPTLSLFYLLTILLTVIWAVDGAVSGSLMVGASGLQFPLIALGLYGLIQIIPLGTYTAADGITAIPRTISLYPFAT